MQACITAEWRKWALGLVLLALAACQADTPAMTPKEKAHMTTLTEHTTTRCVGRYLIDLPQEMKPGQFFGTTIDGVDIKARSMAKAAFEAQLDKRRNTLQNQHMDGHPEQGVLKEVSPLPDGTGVIFNRAKGGISRGSRVLELWGWKSGYNIKMHVKAYDVSFSEYQDDKQLQAIGSNTVEKKKILEDVYARTRGRADDDIPSDPGVCFQHGFVRGPASDSEQIDIAYTFTKMPDVKLHFASDSSIHEDDTLLDRGDNLAPVLRDTHGHTLRKGATNTASGLAFEEWLIALHIYPEFPGDSFTMEVNGGKGGIQFPVAYIDLHNGQTHTANASQRHKASLSDAEAIALWDDITRSLRRRPNGF